MPWCESCEKYRTPSSMNTDGSCPGCGELIEEPPGPSAGEEDLKAPWHFKLMIVALVVYLVWRFWGIFF